MKSLGKLFIVSCLASFIVNTAAAQNSLRADEAQKEAQVKKIVASGDFVFEPEHIKPLSRLYDLKVSKDLLSADLPRWKRHSGNLVLNCTDFSFNKWKDKRGDWDVVIKPETSGKMAGQMAGQMVGKMSGVKQIKMTISPLGYASLHVNTDHGGFNYSGYIKQIGYKIGA